MLVEIILTNNFCRKNDKNPLGFPHHRLQPNILILGWIEKWAVRYNHFQYLLNNIHFTIFGRAKYWLSKN